MFDKKITPRTPIDTLPFVISLERVNLAVGYTALGLPVALWTIARLTGTCPQEGGLDSLSHYYFSRLGGDVFVAALCFIGALMLIFYSVPEHTDRFLNHNRADLALAKVAGTAAFVIAIFPTSGSGCPLSGDAMRSFVLSAPDTGPLGPGLHPAGSAQLAFDFWASFGVGPSLLDQLHNIGALVMFLILAWFSLVVFTRVQSPASLARQDQLTSKKKLRNALYVLCGTAILVCIALLATRSLAFTPAQEAWWAERNLTFWVEALALWSFGISWLIKGRFLRALADPQPPGRAA